MSSSGGEDSNPTTKQKPHQTPTIVIVSESNVSNSNENSQSHTPIATPPPTPDLQATSPSQIPELGMASKIKNEQPPPADYTNVGSTPTPAETNTDTPLEVTPAGSTTAGVTLKNASPSDEKTENAKSKKALKKAKAKKPKGTTKLKCKSKKPVGKAAKKHKKKKTKSSEEDSDSDDESDMEDSDDAAESDDDSSSSSSSSDAETESESDSDSDSEDEKARRKQKKKKAAAKRKAALKKKKYQKSKRDTKRSRRKNVSSSSESESENESDSESEDNNNKKNKRHRKKHGSSHTKVAKSGSEPEDATSAGTVSDVNIAIPPLPVDVSATKTDESQILQQIRSLLSVPAPVTVPAPVGIPLPVISDPVSEDSVASAHRRSKKSSKSSGKKPGKKGKPDYKRVDQIWDNNIHDYKLQETAEEQADEFANFVFHVRRSFDWENKYRKTVVDIKSKYLRDVLKEIMKDVKRVSLVENEPCVDPNILFLYLEEMNTYYKKTLKRQIKKERKRKQRKRLEIARSHLKLMIKYLDKDYDEIKKNLFPMLKAGNITFDLLWALYKPNTIAYTSTYGAQDQPRAFLVDMAYHETHFMRGEFYIIDGRYLEYDGKNFGLGNFEMAVDKFKGPKKITSLPAYPLKYHKDPEGMKQQLIDRGKKFVGLAGMNYKYMKGMAFQKRKKAVLKFNINGRVMIDPKTFRRINANYRVSSVRNTPEEDEDEEDSDEESCGCGGSESEAEEEGEEGEEGGAEGRAKPKFRVVFDENRKPQLVEINSDDEEAEEEEEEEEEAVNEDLDKLPNGTGKNSSVAALKANAESDKDLFKKREFTEQELLIASPIVLGFSFTEKDWFEFSVSDISDIVWNETAFDTLVLPASHKDIVKAQVCSHKFHAAETIDDVIQGKGKGLVFVLHGPPGVGKTLTAEGIAEFLKCPLYAVSAGDLGTDARIEHELNKIMDIAHSWGAVLLLDEADVFLEKRQHQDVHRNALVSIFLRLLEYFQGILFLTTNRVETFDEAFQSRIHIALKYTELTMKAKREIWKLFLQKVKETGCEVANFKDSQYDQLAKQQLNGRQIKNMVKSAQALSVYEKTPLSMEHIKRVLDVAESFNRDLKGGSGYDDAMKSYI